MTSNRVLPRWGRVAGGLAATFFVLAAGSARADEPTAKGRLAAMVPSEEFAPSEDLPLPVPRRHAANVGVQLGVRTGYAVGLGAVYSGLNLSDGSYGALPVIVDLGYRALPEMYIGLYGQYAHVFPKTNDLSCPTGADCSVQDWRFGVQADFHFAPRVSFDPYLGVGFGYEILHNAVHGTSPLPTPAGTATANVDASVIDRGWEFGALSLGADFRVSPEFGIGPFVSGTVGAYNVHTGDRTVSVGGTQVATGPLPDVEHTLHELVIFGARGSFNP